jgi:hypothetical protein
MTVKAPPVVSVTDKAEAFIRAGAKKPPAESTAKERVVVNMRLDRAMVSRVDAYAAKHGLTRTAAMHVLVNTALPPPD